MKKKTLWFMLTMVLTLALALPMASPSLAWQGASTDVDITAVPGQVPCEGGPVLLTITETNNSLSTYIHGFTDVSVELQPIGGGLLVLVKGDAYWIGGDTGNDGVLDLNETWEWRMSVWVDTDTTFVAIGRGTTDDGTVMTWYEDPTTRGHWPSERAEVPVTVGPCDDGEGFTPGYWKTKNHQDDWAATGYSQTDSFLAVFGVGPTPDKTLLQAVKTGGGGERALIRHGVAALLNAAHPGVAYPLTVAEVIAMVQLAYSTGDFGYYKDILAGFNELGGDM